MEHATVRAATREITDRRLATPELDPEALRHPARRPCALVTKAFGPAKEAHLLQLAMGDAPLVSEVAGGVTVPNRQSGRVEAALAPYHLPYRTRTLLAPRQGRPIDIASPCAAGAVHTACGCNKSVSGLIPGKHGVSPTL